MNDKKASLQTYCVKEYKDNKSTSPHQLPIYATSSFEMESVDGAIDIFTGKTEGHVYSRYGNPTIDTVAQKVANLESYGLSLDSFGYLTSSGMSAISTLMYALAESGDEILTQGNLYGGTTELFKKVMNRHNVKSHFVNFDNKENIINAIEENNKIKFIYLETPANPTLACVDLASVSEIAKAQNLITIIDNTFCTPYIQQPFAFGIDFVIHSTTKYLNGHGNSIAGAIIGRDSTFQNEIWTTLKLMGSTSNAWDAWLLNNGLKTLALRMEKHSENAQFLAERLQKTKGIKKVNYCGLEDSPYFEIAQRQMRLFGGMLSFEIDGNLNDTKKFIDALTLCTHAPTLGDVDSLVLHPATSSHLNIAPELRKEYGITDSLVRLSVGIESKDDLLADIISALEAI